MRRLILQGVVWSLMLAPIVSSAEGHSSLESAREHLTRGNYGAALGEARDLLYDDPRDEQALYVAGVAALNLGRLNDAEKFLERARRATPGTPEVEYQLGVVLLRMADGFFERGKDKMARGLCDEALEHFESELERSPDHSGAISKRATAYLKSGRVDEAIRAYQKWIETDPDNLDVYVQLVRLYTAQDDLESARALLPRVPGGPTAGLAEATFLVARADYADGKVDDGRALLQQLQSLPAEPWQIAGLKALDAVSRFEGHEAASSLMDFLNQDPPQDEVEIIAAVYHKQYREMRRATREAAAEQGGDSSDDDAGDSLPKLELRVSHIYPLDARRYGIEGDVLLLAIVGVDGSISELSVVSSTVSRHASLYRSDFEDAATTAIQQWRYLPARRKGKPIAFPVTVKVRFSQ